MAGMLPDVLLLFLSCIFGNCTVFKESLAKLVFFRLIVQFLLFITELIFLEISVNKKENVILGNSTSVTENALRYSVISSLCVYLAVGIWFFHHFFFSEDSKLTMSTPTTDAEPGDMKHIDRKLLKTFCLFKLLDTVVDSLMLGYCTVIFNDFDVALPFFAIPSNGVNLTAWIISFVSFIDILFGVVELAISLCKLKTNSVGHQEKTDSKTTDSKNNEVEPW